MLNLNPSDKLREVRYIAEMLSRLYVPSIWVSNVRELTAGIIADLRKQRVTEVSPRAVVLISRDLYYGAFGYNTALSSCLDPTTNAELLKEGYCGVMLGMDMFTTPDEALQRDWLPPSTLIVVNIDGKTLNLGEAWGVRVMPKEEGRTLIHVTAGGSEWSPTTEEMEQLRLLFENATPKGGVVITRADVVANVLHLDGRTKGGPVTVTVKRVDDGEEVDDADEDDAPGVDAPGDEDDGEEASKELDLHAIEIFKGQKGVNVSQLNPGETNILFDYRTRENIYVEEFNVVLACKREWPADCVLQMVREKEAEILSVYNREKAIRVTTRSEFWTCLNQGTHSDFTLTLTLSVMGMPLPKK